MAEVVPARVLSDALREAVRGRRVRAAVFTTFTFDPGFFEEEVLPLLFSQPFSHRPAVRLVQLEEALRTVDHLAVYYDRRALAQGGAPALLDYRRVPMSRRQGYFHPKVILMIAEGGGEQGAHESSLIVAVSSANLTRAGWWENVECAHVAEYPEGSRCSLRRDLIALAKLIVADERTGDEHAALNEVRRFLRHRLDDEPDRRARGTLHPRLFLGQQALADFLSEELRLPAEVYNLEVVSPYFDDGEAGALRLLVERLRPRETRVFLPRADDGAALCRERYFCSVADVNGARWGSLPRPLVARSAKGDGNQPDRFVHAKVYRLWSRAEGREYLVVGSANLTRAAHGKSSAGNLEAAALLDFGPGRAPQFWLEVVEEPPQHFRVEESGEGAHDAEPPPLSLRYLWDRGVAEYFWDEDAGKESQTVVLASAGSELHRITPVEAGGWTALPPEVSARLADLLGSTSLLEASDDAGRSGLILVREEGMSHKPSLLFTLSAEEILRYWSLLSPEQREAFLSNKELRLLVARGSGAGAAPRHEAVDSIFDRFAGIFHAFHRLDEHVTRAVESGCVREAEYRLFGRKYDSLPSLLEKVFGGDEMDLVNRYVAALTAAQLLRRLRRRAASDRRHAEFLEGHRREVGELERTLAGVGRLREQFGFGTAEERARFFGWFDRMFTAEARPPEPRL